MKTRDLFNGASIALALVLLPILGGCAVTAQYPSDWPRIGAATLVGTCPDISGKYRNSGVSHPYGAKQLLLFRILGLCDGNFVDIAQSPDAITVSVWNAGERADTVTFLSGEGGIDWDMSRPRTFICPVDILGGRILLFSDLERGKQSIDGA